MRYSSLLLLCTGSIAVAGVAVAPARPLITPGPSIAEVELRRRVDSSRMDLGSLAQVLLTDVPPSLLDLAITNIPALSKILWSEFLDSNTPSWFTALPSDVQAYLSGQFGPTTAASNTASSTSTSQTTSVPSASQTAANNQLDNSHDSHHSGLPLWAKILIGVLVPLLILGLLACLLLCCLRRRRRHRKAARAQSRTPTPAFVSSSHRAAPHGTHGEQHVPLRGGYLTSTDSSRHNSDHIPHHHSSSSEEFRTPIGGPSYEELPAPVTGAQALRRSSRQSLSSLHSVPEVPEPMHGRGAPVPLPPRSPRRSRDFSQDATLGNTPGTKSSRRVSPLNPMYNANQPNPYYNQGIYAGGHNPYPDHSYHSSENPFADHSPPQQGGYMPYRSSYGDGSSRDQELFFNGHGNRHSQEPEGNWPLQALEDGGYRTAGRGRPHEVYEKVYEM